MGEALEEDLSLNRRNEMQNNPSQDAALEAVINAIGRMNITEEERAKIFLKNARKILKLS